ncbi:MAG TPA: glycosyl hydrolase [Solirubrobacteraceae bacterium]|nr:glycosyl hydrolase [Solirubrobacteraceae bacterium]
MALSSAPSARSATLSGAYAGPANVIGLARFAHWRGARTTVALDYLNDSRWQDIARPSWYLRAWRGYTRRGGQLVLSVPLLVNASRGSFAAGARGTYDRYYRSLGRRLVTDGYGNAILRMGWEFNGTWFRWSLSRTDPAMGPHAFVLYWRHLVDLFRGVHGSHFSFDWTVNPGPGPVPAAGAYPGNAYVDYVGVDVYDRSWNRWGGRILSARGRWHQIADQPHGLNWWLGFARAHGKRISIPEWGLYSNEWANGAGDDPSFIIHMHRWFTQHHPAYQMYFNWDDSELDTPGDPRASQVYRRLFGTF